VLSVCLRARADNRQHQTLKLGRLQQMTGASVEIELRRILLWSGLVVSKRQLHG
jgi:hypothetical protein